MAVAVRLCSSCEREICKQNRSGLCRTCSCRRMTSDPEIDARRRANHIVACRTPENRKGSSERMKAYLRDNEAALQARRERGIRDYHKTIGSPQAREANNRPECIAKRTRASQETRMGWCPPEYRQAYLDLIRKKQLRKPEAQRIILAEIAAKQPKPPRRTAFEDQLERVRQGAGIIEVRPIPRRIEPQFTLGGVSSI